MTWTWTCTICMNDIEMHDLHDYWAKWNKDMTVCWMIIWLHWHDHEHWYWNWQWHWHSFWHDIDELLWKALNERELLYMTFKEHDIVELHGKILIDQVLNEMIDMIYMNKMCIAWSKEKQIRKFTDEK